MNFLQKEIRHKIFGDGVVIDWNERTKTLTVKFSDKETKLNAAVASKNYYRFLDGETEHAFLNKTRQIESKKKHEINKLKDKAKTLQLKEKEYNVKKKKKKKPAKLTAEQIGLMHPFQGGGCSGK